MTPVTEQKCEHSQEYKWIDIKQIKYIPVWNCAHVVCVLFLLLLYKQVLNRSMHYSRESSKLVKYGFKITAYFP